MGRARALLLVTVVIWGWTFVATKVALTHVRPVELLALRMLVGLPAIGLLLLARRPTWNFGVRQHAAAALASLLFTAHFLVQITGLVTTTATNTGWIITVTPLVIAVLSRVLLGERPGGRIVAGIALASAGVLLLVSRGQVHDLGWLRSTGDWLVLGSAFTWAVYTIATRDLSRARDPAVVTFVVLVPTTLLAAGYVAFTSGAADWQRLLHAPGSAVLAVLYLGVLGTALAQWFWQIGLARLGAAKAGVFLYLEPLATTALAVPLLGESFGLVGATGAALVLAGVWWAESSRRAG